jgi:phosphatidylglycerophosphate synthase
VLIWNYFVGDPELHFLFKYLSLVCDELLDFGFLLFLSVAGSFNYAWLLVSLATIIIVDFVLVRLTSLSRSSGMVGSKSGTGAGMVTLVVSIS